MEKLFLHLLGTAIRNVPPDAALFKNVDAATWKKMERMAKKQSVSALIADKALSLPEGSLPPREQVMVCITQIEQTKALNRKMIHVLQKLVEEYAKEELPFVLLKGLSNGVNYPEPLLRNPGDIDLLIYRKGDYERSIEWIVGKGIKTEIGDHIHYKFDVDGISIENHCRITYFDHKKYDRLFAAWEKELSEKENFTSIEIGGATVRQLPVEMNAFFIFQHLFRHFVHLGVGFRQYCDWLLFLSTYRSEIDPGSFTRIAESYALLYPMQVFARAAVKYLDMPESIFPFEMITDDQHADMVMEDIFDSGNFGFHKPGKQRPVGKMQGMWFSYKNTVRRARRFGALSPEHSRILPFTKLIKRMKIGLR
ncbi:nucleotidyltransferase domain-containing protein [Proteiniphilum sp. UBA5384]|uniref:nucleotidyltransferase domain-containing protein n=1 Tax=Proteiniphilum sp. UBA5384 TaxID=1947279 RepID=UPI0025FB3736|nr:nucleotidyltransferase family protein [Proteiniphilum sp. UBA5384]